MGVPVEAKKVTEPSAEEKRQQVARIVASRTLRSSPLLQKFLEFIASNAASGDVSEYAIATQVLGRPADFDPASDTSVRTQAYRLRTKLKEYYESEGRTDRIIVDIPKGHYVPAFSERLAEPASTLPESIDEGTKTAFWLRPYMLAAVAVALLIGLALGISAGARWFAPKPDIAAKAIPATVRQFWGGFLTSNEVIVAYTNSVFLETETGDLLRFRGGAVADRGSRVASEAVRANALNPDLASRAGTVYYEDGFTGTGEVIGVHRLTTLLESLGASVVVKRSRLVSAEDFRNHDVIFLGSPFDNEALAEMNFPQRFSFVFPKEPPFLWRGEIVDGKEKNGYKVERDPRDQVIRADYALFNVLPGPASGRKIMILAGLTTSGTQGAAEFATSENGLRRVLDVLGKDQKFPTHFESLLRVEAAKGLDAITVRYVTGNPVKVQE